MSVRLFQRTTRKLSLTTEGKLLYSQCLEPLRALEAAHASVQASSKALSGLVRMTCATSFGTTFIAPIVAEFQVLHPKVQVELHLDDSVSDIVLAGYDLGIRIGLLHDSSLVARPIAKLPFVACASPAYLAQNPAPQSPEDLLRHNCLRLRQIGRAQSMPWMLKGIAPELEKRISGNYFVNDFSALVLAAVRGQGIAYAPLPLVMPYLRARQLKAMLTEWMEPRLTVYLYFPNRKNLPARTRRLIDFTLDRLSNEADLQTPHHTLTTPFLASPQTLSRR